MKRHLHILGPYITAVALAHLCLYILLRGYRDEAGWLFYFDTRIGFFFIETLFQHSEGKPPALTAWLSELYGLILGVSILLGRNLVKVYAVVESLLSIPYVLFFVLVIAVGMSANHGFSPEELIVPTLTVVFARVVPLGYAYWILFRSGKESELSIA